MTHTPGPWTLPAVIVNGHAIPVYNDDGSHKIAHVLTGVDDARLTAAAPDLLAALKNVMLHLPDFADEDQHAIVAACDAARAAIAKAEGR